MIEKLDRLRSTMAVNVLISYFNLRIDALCYVNFEAGEISRILILVKFGIMLF